MGIKRGQFLRRKVGTRHHLLLYERAWNRTWKNTLPIGLVLAFVWASHDWIGMEISPFYDMLLLFAALSLLGFALLTFLLRKMAYVQARADHLRLATPLYWLKIPYRRIRTVRSYSLEHLFPVKTTKAFDRNLLAPFYGRTVAVVELNGFPVSRRLLRLFLPATMFSPKSSGLVLIVKDWMALATEIDSFKGAWLQEQSQRPRSGPGGFGQQYL